LPGIKPEIFRFAQHDNYLNPIHEDAASNFQTNMNNQQPRDKAGSPRRLRIMKNDHTLYGILAGSEEKGRGVMETAIYATCILSVVAAIFQFIAQPTPDPFAVFYQPTQPVPVVSHTTRPVWGTKS
jgi:hypothetical protein